MKTTVVKKVNLGSISVEEARDQNLSNSSGNINLFGKLKQVFLQVWSRFLKLFHTEPTQNRFHLSTALERDVVTHGDTLVSKLKNIFRTNHYAIYMHDFWRKYKLTILVCLFLTVGLLTLTTILWHLFANVGSKNVKDDTNVVQANTPTLESQPSVNDIEEKKAELEKLNESTAELDRILAEKEEIYTRLVALTDEPMTMQSLEEVKALQKRNDELNKVLDTKYPEWNGEEV